MFMLMLPIRFLLNIYYYVNILTGQGLQKNWVEHFANEIEHKTHIFIHSFFNRQNSINSNKENATPTFQHILIM